MSEKRRNLAVGATVLVAMALLGGMILRFAGVPEMFQRGYEIKMESDAAHDVHEGDLVHLAGMNIGRITKMAFTDPNDPIKGVTFTARIDWNVNIPGNAVCWIYGGALTKGTYIDIKTANTFLTDPRTGQKLQILPKDYPVTLAAVAKGSSLIPEEMTDAVKSFGKLADSLQSVLGQPPSASTDGPTSATSVASASAPAEPAGLPATLAKLNRTLDAMYAVMGDTQNQANIKLALGNLATFSGNAIEVMNKLKEFASAATLAAGDAGKLTTQASGDLHALTQKFIEDAEKMSQLLMTLNKAAMKIDSGDGTAGKFLNDPQLYNSMAEMATGLNKLVQDFDALVKQWKEKGVEMKLK